MADKTSNHELNLYEQGDENWTHTSDMETIEERLIVRDLEQNRDSYTAYKDGLFFATDSEIWYIGTGTSWVSLGTLDESTLTHKSKYVGPFHNGAYHSENGEYWGIVFEAVSGTTLHSTVIDVDLSTANLDTITVELYQVDSRDENVVNTTNDPVNVTSSTVLNEGPNRIDLGFTIPDGDEYNEYYLTIVPETDENGNQLQFRRIKNWNGWDDYSDLSDTGINLLQGGRMNNPTASNYSNYYYYMFDLEIGSETTRMMSPWSHDIEEIYMRPRDPEEEFDDISPRSLWIDTSK